MIHLGMNQGNGTRIQQELEVILKPDRDIIISRDKKRMAEIVDYLRKLIDNKFEYMPFGEPEVKLELSGAETEFMDI